MTPSRPKVGRSYSWVENIRFIFTRSSPQGLLVFSFAGLILLGSMLLSLPWAHTGEPVTYLDALFTSTSAVCVTGLIVVDTATAYSLFGQIVIIVLIQLGGLGVMTFAALIFRLMGRRMSLTSRAALHDAFFQEEKAAEFRHLFGRILRMTLVIEGIGALIIFLTLLDRTDASHGLFSAVFHSISAFCNAGFSIYTDNLMQLKSSWVVVTAVMVLIVLGGLGHTVLQELRIFVRTRFDREARANGKPHWFSPHARVVLTATLILIGGGTLLLLLFGMTGEEAGFGSRLWTSLFQSVTARTAGFNTVNIGALPYASLMLLSVLMFIGGSPGSCAGGVKTTTAAIWVARLRARLLGEDDPRLLGRRVPSEVLRRTTILMSVALVWNLVGVLLLSATELGGAQGVAGAYGVDDIIFEQLSAFGTVGLSTGITSALSTAGRIWIIATMFIGRLGPLTIATWIVSRDNIRVRYPEGKVMIG